MEPSIQLSPQAGGPLLSGILPASVPFLFRFRYVVEGVGPRDWVPAPEEMAPGRFTSFTVSNEDMTVEFEATGGDDSVCLSWVLTAAKTLRLEQVIPVELPWPFPEPPSHARIFQSGFQSWTPGGSLQGDQEPLYPRLSAFSQMNHHVDSPFWGRRDGLLSHDLLLVRGSRQREAVLLGFTSSRVGLGELFVKNRGTPSVHASLDYGSRTMVAGARLEGEPLMLARGQPGRLLERWAAETGRRMGVTVRPEPSPVGWCSWYQYKDKVREKDILQNLEVSRRRPELGVQVVQLDDGYQRSVGDWLDLKPEFPRGLAQLAADIRKQGLKAGIWLAPFFVEPASTIFKEHPDWLLRTTAGAAVCCGFNPVWRSRLYALDLTNPEVLAWLRDLFRFLVAAGFDYFKLDFLYAGLRHGAAWAPDRSPVEAYRQALGVIREEIGGERFILGCGAPIGPSVGLVDGMRVSADVDERWDNPVFGLLARGAGYPSARLALAGTLCRTYTHRRLWLNDPDCLILRHRPGKMTPEEVETLVTVVGVSGGPAMFSDELASLPEERLELATAVLPPTTLACRSMEIIERNPPDRVLLESEVGRLAVVVNWTSRVVSRALPFSTEAGPVFDFWSGTVLKDGGALSIPRHGVRVLLQVNPPASPHLVGTTLNMTAILDGRLTAAWDPDGRVLEIRGRGMARQQGRIWLAVSAGLAPDMEAVPAMVERAEGWKGGVVLSVTASSPDWSLALPFRVSR